ncbi:hypothetical protein ACIBP6_25965 [Nonomuraea terrae]|uniref:hypothetical protein n=1 Tax=Nonomuraea terrae TaxID=2530383 RepID=UPI0037B8D9B7
MRNEEGHPGLRLVIAGLAVAPVMIPFGRGALGLKPAAPLSEGVRPESLEEIRVRN